MQSEHTGNNTRKRLYRLGELTDYQVANDDPDVRGWEVVDCNKKLLGTVNDYIVDPDIMKVRYLVVKVNPKYGDGNSNLQVLVPVGLATIHERFDHVQVNCVDVDNLNSYPAHSMDEITRDYEYAIRRRYEPDMPIRSDENDQEFYAHNHFDDVHFYGKQRSQTGQVRQ